MFETHARGKGGISVLCDMRARMAWAVRTSNQVVKQRGRTPLRTKVTYELGDPRNDVQYCGVLESIMRVRESSRGEEGEGHLRDVQRL